MSVKQEENEDEEDLLDQVSSVLTAVLKQYRDLCMPLVDSLMPSLAPLLDPQRTAEERRVAICILDDILEYSPAGALPHPHSQCSNILFSRTAAGRIPLNASLDSMPGLVLQ